MLAGSEEAQDAYDDYTMHPCDKIVWTREHAVAEKKPINDLDVLNRQLNDPDDILRILRTPGGKRYYIIRYAENKIYTLVSQPFELGGFLLETMLTGPDGGFYKSLDEALDDIDDDAEEISDGENYDNC